MQFDPDEIIVFVGPTHVHFTQFEEPDAPRAIDEALAFIRDVLSNRVILWSCLGASGFYKVNPARRRVPWRVSRFLWSRPV